MEPEYHDGDLVLLDPDASLAIGATVVARHPFKNLDVIKYVNAIDTDGYVVLSSPGGEDSEQFGRVPIHTVQGTVTWCWKSSSQPDR